MPPPNLQLCAYDTTGLHDIDIWSLADERIADRTVYGRGDVAQKERAQALAASGRLTLR
jgi:hypothetical protein